MNILDRFQNAESKEDQKRQAFSLSDLREKEFFDRLYQRSLEDITKKILASAISNAFKICKGCDGSIFWQYEAEQTPYFAEFVCYCSTFDEVQRKIQELNAEKNDWYNL